jgi:hypothetical protein
MASSDITPLFCPPVSERRRERHESGPTEGHPYPSSMAIPQVIPVSLIVAVCAAATGRLAWSVVEFVYWCLTKVRHD